MGILFIGRLRGSFLTRLSIRYGGVFKKHSPNAMQAICGFGDYCMETFMGAVNRCLCPKI